MQGSPRHRLDLLQRFADESIDIEEFSASYWSIRCGRHFDRMQLEDVIQPLERDLLSYTPDPKPEGAPGRGP